MKKIILFIAALSAMISCAQSSGPRTVSDFNFGWRFTLGDEAVWSEPSFNDSEWRELHLPHDWSIEGEFSQSNPAGINCGALPGGIGWYRKDFVSPDADKTFIEFDGIYMNSTVWVNGQEVGFRPYGYISFNYDLTPYLNPAGEMNTIAVRVDNSTQPSGRWYTGCGIYRSVRLVSTSSCHFEYDGVFVTTPEVSAEKATVSVQAEVIAPEGTEYKVVNTVLDSKGRAIVSGGDSLELPSPKMWDIVSPNLYTLRSQLYVNDVLVDQVDNRFGVRTFAWDAQKGFFLNGRSVKVYGVCLHHDLGCIGTAVHRRALERELSIMQEMGVNAIRTAHNMPAPELVELCDEMGLLVMDEAFDSWRSRKTKYDYGQKFEEWHERDLAAFVRRDRNHPSVFMWSIGNEISEQGARDAEAALANQELTRELANIVKANDTTRPVTAGTNKIIRNNCLIESGALDVIGLNYHIEGYDSLRKWYPDAPVIASETASALNSRGIYYQPSTELRTLPRQSFSFGGFGGFGGFNRPAVNPDEPVSHQCTAYDICHSFWATTDTHQDAWIPVKNRDDVAGVFVWTGFDYLGEPTAFNWPSRSSYFGICDLAGFPKDMYWMYQSEWTDKTVLHLHPHWNWNEGDKIDMWAYYNNADEVELFLNGKSLGRSVKTDNCLHAFWPEVPFEPGKIEAVSYKDGKVVARHVRETTGPATGLKLEADRKTIAADGYDLSYVTITAVDKKGREVPDSDMMLNFKVKGKGELFGIDNGNAADTLCLKGNQKQLFCGKAIAVIRSEKGEKGSAKLIVSSEGIKESISINIK